MLLKGLKEVLEEYILFLNKETQKLQKYWSSLK